MNLMLYFLSETNKQKKPNPTDYIYLDNTKNVIEYI